MPQTHSTHSKTEFLAGYQTTDETVRLAQKQKWLEKWEGRQTKNPAIPIDRISREARHIRSSCNKLYFYFCLLYYCQI